MSGRDILGEIKSNPLNLAGYSNKATTNELHRRGRGFGALSPGLVA